MLLLSVLLSSLSALSCHAAEPASVALDPIVILGSRIESNPEGRTVGKVSRKDIESTDAFSLRELMDAIPGAFVKQSNGPRDVSISLRGSGAKVSFGVRNIKVYEDWFPTTQSDGLSRTDLHDPNAYESVDVLRGPSSALYDNYALGGVVNFRTRKGGDIDGIDVGSAGGSYGYQNHYVHAGKRYERFEYSFFGSLVRGDGWIDHSGFTTTTQNLLATFRPDEERTIVFKFLSNDLSAQVPSRLTWNEFNTNAKSAGTTNVTGVGVVTPQQTAQNRRDRRTIIGGRYERKLSPETGFRFLGAYDLKDINQTFGTIGDNENPQFHQYADITHESTLFGKNARHYGGVFFNYMEQEASSFRNLADGEGTRGALQSNTRGYHRNVGLRAREEIDLSQEWTAIAGAGVESSEVHADVQTRTAAEMYSRVGVNRRFYNAAPEAVLQYKPAQDLKFHARTAMAYAVPGISQLTTTPDGLSGNNTALKPQRNLGFELGGEGKLGWFGFNAALYHEFFYNELVTRSPGAGLSNFTANAPRSEHRGAEVSAEMRHPSGPFLSGAYTFNDHYYTSFQETLTGTAFDRSRKRIPGVEEHVVNGRLGFDCDGLPGGWLELNHVGGFYVNNSNTLRARPYTILNANTHYKRGRVSLFVEVRNLADLTYQSSAVVVADAATDTPTTLLSGKQAFFTGPGRSFSTGVKLHF